MTIPLGGAGHVRLDVDVTDIDALTPAQRTAIADTGSEFCAFAAATLAPPGGPALVPATIHDPNGAVLGGVTGSRIRDKL